MEVSLGRNAITSIKKTGPCYLCPWFLCTQATPQAVGRALRNGIAAMHVCLKHRHCYGSASPLDASVRQELDGALMHMQPWLTQHGNG